MTETRSDRAAQERGWDRVWWSRVEGGVGGGWEVGGGSSFKTGAGGGGAMTLDCRNWVLFLTGGNL